MLRRGKQLLTILTAVMLFSAAVPGPGAASTLTLPAMLREIGASAFEDDTSLDEVVLPDQLETIGARAFAGSSVTRVHLPDSLTFIAGDAFDGADSAELSANRGTYAWRWLYGNDLAFQNDQSYEVNATLGIFEESEEAGIFNDFFVQFYHLDRVEELFYTLNGDPVWTVTQTAGPKMYCWLDQPNPYCASLCVETPETPSEAAFEVLCVWDGLQVSSRVNVRYEILTALPEGTDIPDLIELRANEENIIPMHFLPEGYAFGSMDRGSLADYTGDGDYWVRGHDLHMIPRTEGTFTGVITLYAANLFMSKNVTFRVSGSGDGLSPAAEAARTDCCALSWNPAPGAEKYTVRAYLDEECSWEYRSVETENCFVYFNTDVGATYWFTVEYTGADGTTVCSAPVRTDPLPVLGGPAHAAAEAGEDGKVRLTWDPVEGASGYRIYFSGSPEWTPETEWFSQGPETENGDLSIGENETMYIWVCADNGNGPHLRTGTLVFRYDDILSVLEDEEITLSSLTLDFEEYPLLPADGATDAETLVLVNEYNTLAAKLNGDVADYNAFVAEKTEPIEAFMSGVSGSVGEGFTIDGYQVSAEALNVLSGEYEITDSEADGDALLISLRSASGGTVRLRMTDAGIGIDGAGRSGALRSRAVPTDEIGLGGALAETAFRELYGRGASRLNDIRLGNMRVEQEIARLNQKPTAAMTGKERSKILRACKNNEARTAARVKAYGFLEAAGKGAGIADDALSLTKDIQSLEQLRAFMNEHGHPTALESQHAESLVLASQLPDLYREAGRWLRADAGVNGISLALSFAKLHPAGAVAFAVGTYAANKWLDARVNAVCAEMTRIEGMLHYEVTGTVRDAETGEALADVTVTCEMPSFSPMNVRTDAQGLYRLEPLTDSFTLKFSKEPYNDLSESIPEAGRSVERDVAYPYHAKMSLGTGVVTGSILDADTKMPLAGVTVSCGEYSAVSGTGGTYRLELPVGTRTLCFDRDGYISEKLEAEIEKDKSVRGDMELRDCFVIRTREDLVNVQNNPGARYCLGNDIDLGGEPWTPAVWFSGELDGKGFAIRNMTVEASNGGNAGLFAGLTDGAALKNLNVTGASVSVPANDSYVNTGILCGNMLGSAAVQDSFFSGTVLVYDGSADGQVFAGGISGLVTQGSVKGCRVSADISVNFRNNIHAGGLYGQIRSGTVEYCEYAGTVTGTQTGNNAGVQVYAAGLGYSSGVYAGYCQVSGGIRATAAAGEAIAVGLIRARHGTNHAGVNASSTGGRAYAAGCQDGNSLDNHGPVSASSIAKNADAAGLNSVSSGHNYGSVSASSYHGDTTAIGVVGRLGSVNSGPVTASSVQGNHYAADYD